MGKWARRTRILQRLFGIHRIHDIRYAYGWKLPFVNWAYFPPWRVRDGSPNPPWRRYGWQRVQRTTYHDCTITGVY